MTETDIKKARLTKLIAFMEWLRANEPQRLDLREWIDYDPGKVGPLSMAEALLEDAERLRNLQTADEEHLCGTTGCLVGHLPVIFPEDFTYRDEAVLLCTDDTPFILANHTASYAGLQDVYPGTKPAFLKEYFGGTSAEWNMIIYSSNYPDLYDEELFDELLKRLKRLFKDTYGMLYHAPDRPWTKL